MAAKAKIFFDASPEEVFAVLTEYESYPEFIPEISRAKILEEGPGYIVADFILNAGKAINYVLRFQPEPYSGITWSYVRGDLRDNKGSWKLRPKKGGTEGIYEVSMDFGRLMPKFVINAVAGVGLPNVMKRFKDRVESDEMKKTISLPAEVAAYEQRLIQRYLRRAQRDITQTAALLSISEEELRQKMKDFEIE